MRQSKCSETQIVTILKEADTDRPVNEIWRHYGISSATYYKWKAKYGGLAASDVKRFRTLNILDEEVREGLAIEVDTSLPAERLIRVLEHVMAWRGLPPSDLPR